ncbi:sugar porter family MFS transporter [Fulvivirgaceae bacterium PWU4]|uniref:Sugar porter family MFS transporter n=1 Tax=Chryseosolibacter histidini TaxID=2782349 RepID=A0AAP2DQ77_9BACT|nr:sugar porter family MFS transporter [Chryseosolibacter histidini]MBT1699227.1 sugar porter family MFS transporter [Chryseosolibacter histidini]
MRTNSYIIFISLIAAFGGLLFGFDIAVFSGTIPFIQPYYELTEAQLGWTGSSLYIGCIIGTLFTGYATDRFGRKPLLIVAAGIFTISSVLMGWAGSYNMLIFWRIIAGIGVGAASMLSPLYIAEISPANIRGRMVSINQLTIVIGILLAYFINYLLADAENNWRWMFTSGAIPSALFFFCIFLVPESPRWLVSKGYVEKAKEVLKKVNGGSRVNDDIRSIQAGVRGEVRGKLSDLIQHGVTFVVLLGITMAVFQQISGANAVFFYAPIIFEKAGMDVKDQLFQQIMIGAINLVFTLVAMQLVDRLGRKKLMLGGSSLMAVWLFLVGICYYFNLFEGYWLTFFVLAFIATYATTLAPVTWVLISEIFPTRIRGVAVSVSTCMLWVACFALAYGFPVLIEWLNAPQTFFLFSGICLLYFFILLRFAPETKGKTLEQFETEIIRH